MTETRKDDDASPEDGLLLLGWKHHQVNRIFDSSIKTNKDQQEPLLLHVQPTAQIRNQNKIKSKGIRRWGLGKIVRSYSSDSSTVRLVSERPVHTENVYDRDRNSDSDSDNSDVSSGPRSDGDGDGDGDDELSYDNLEVAQAADVRIDDGKLPQSQNPQLKQRTILNRFSTKGEENLNTSLLSNKNDEIQEDDDDVGDNSISDNVVNYSNKIQGFGGEHPKNDLQKKKIFSGLVEAFQKRRLRARGEFDAEGLSRQELDLLKRDVEMNATNNATMQSMNIDITQDPLEEKGGKLRWKDRVKTLAAAAFAPEEYLDHLVDPINGAENKGFYLNIPSGDDNGAVDDMDFQEKNMRQMKTQGEKMTFCDVVQFLQDEPQIDQYSDEEPGGFYNTVSGDDKQTDLLSTLNEENAYLLNQVALLRRDLKQKTNESEAWRLEAIELQRKLDVVVASKNLAGRLIDSDEEDMIRVDSDEESDSNRKDRMIMKREAASYSSEDNNEEDMISIGSETPPDGIVTEFINVQREPDSELDRDVKDMNKVESGRNSKDSIYFHNDSSTRTDNDNADDLAQAHSNSSFDVSVRSSPFHFESAQECVQESNEEKSNRISNVVRDLLHLTDDCKLDDRANDDILLKIE
jgi:hypothetical protein